MAKTHGRLSWASLVVLGGAVTAWPAACTSDVSPEPGDPVVQDLVTQVLSALTYDVIIPEHERARDAATTLLQATQAWHDAELATDGGTAKLDAQAAWFDMMTVWQGLELMQIGPAGDPQFVTGGQDLRNEIYSWPSDNACHVDQETVESNYLSAQYFENELVTAYGLDAMEYLLFVEDEGHACPSQVQINAGGAWDDLVTAGIDAARAAHAVTVSQRIIDDLDGMSDAWTAGFAVQFSDPTESDNGVFATHDEALTAAFHALFYIEGQTKDRKLAIPLGLRNCSSDVCPAEAESPHASASLEHIAANIDGFEHLFFGADGGMGFDDLLIDRGYEALVTEMEQAIVSARTAVAAVDGSLETAIVDDLDSVIAVYDGTKSMTDLLKGDISTALLLQIPSELVGDND